MKTMPRLFVAVRIPLFAPLVDAIAPLQHVRGVAVVAPENLHYTIRFIGDVSETMGARIQEAFAIGEVEVTPFDLEVIGLSAFPSPVTPKVVWAGVDDEGSLGLSNVAGAVDGFVDAAGLGARDKPFVPHLTVARVKRADGRGIDTVRRVLEAHQETPFGIHRVASATLVHSTLTPQGPTYTDIAEVALA